MHSNLKGTFEDTERSYPEVRWVSCLTCCDSSEIDHRLLGWCMDTSRLLVCKLFCGKIDSPCSFARPQKTSPNTRHSDRRQWPPFRLTFPEPASHEGKKSTPLFGNHKRVLSPLLGSYMVCGGMASICLSPLGKNVKFPVVIQTNQILMQVKDGHQGVNGKPPAPLPP